MSTPEHGPAMSSQEIYDRLKLYSDKGLIEYVLPTEPLGERWVLGVPGLGLVKLTGDGEAIAFIVGSENIIRNVARAQGLIP